MIEIEEIKFKCVPVHERYYSSDSSYGVFVFHTKDDIPEYDLVPPSPFQTNTEGLKMSMLVGNMQQLYIGSEYEVTATLDYNAKYKSYQYKPKIITSVTPKTEEQQKMFLTSIITDRQAETLLEKYPNIVEDIIKGIDNVDLKELKGIGEMTYQSIKEKVLENYVISDILILLQPLGVKYSMIKKLLMGEPNPALLKEKLLDNPYIMLDLRGFGFKTVDSLALKLNPDIKVSAKRTYAFIKYHLKEIGNKQGHTWVNIETLENAVRDNIPECMDVFERLIESEREKEIILHFDGDKVGLYNYYELERDVYSILKDIQSYPCLELNEEDINEGISQAEKEQGFELTDEQKKVVKASLNDNVCIIAGKAGCVDCDTEFFNGTEWKKISEYKEGEFVLQYNSDGTANLVQPLDYIKVECDELNLLQNDTKSVNQCVCDEHNLVVKTSKGNVIKKPFKTFLSQHSNSELGSQDRFISYFKYDGVGIDLSDEQIRVMIAFIADGSFGKSKNGRVRIFKERKCVRMRQLLKNAKISYEERINNDMSNNFYFEPPIYEKHFSSYWYQCSQHQLQIIADELQYWDGNYENVKNRGKGIEIYSVVKSDIDFIQFVYAATGHRTSILTQNRVGEENVIEWETYIRKSIDYSVHVSKNKNVSLRARRVSNYNKIQRVKTKDGFKYCFTVPSGMLVLRREGTINITGNCGKSTLARALLNIYKHANYSISCCALSAKAAQRITEATGFPASTIHRLLGVNPQKGFEHDHETPLTSDVILIDECSMINSYVYHAIVSAIKEGAKVIMCGDNRQLPPIGYGNIFGDLLLKTDSLHISHLTKVLRQAEKSGILSDANKIREGIMPIEQPELRIVNGELQDMTYMFRDTREGLRNIAVKSYLKAIEQDGMDEVAIIVPRKENCDNSTLEINIRLSDILLDKNGRTMKIGKKEYLVGSKVMQVDNNYEKNVFNGEVGYITKIEEVQNGKEKTLEFTVEFKMNDQTKVITYTRNELDQLDLAYAMTIHKSQGSGYKTVIIIIDMTHYTLLDTCLLYTAITRAKKRCLLLAEPQAFKMCMDNNKSKSRQTWLKEM